MKNVEYVTGRCGICGLCGYLAAKKATIGLYSNKIVDVEICVGCLNKIKNIYEDEVRKKKVEK